METPEKTVKGRLALVDSTILPNRYLNWIFFTPRKALRLGGALVRRRFFALPALVNPYTRKAEQTSKT